MVPRDDVALQQKGERGRWKTKETAINQNKYDFFQEGTLFKGNRVLRYVRKHEIKTPSKTASIARLQLNGINELHDTLKQIHQRQTNQYMLDIWLGYK
jgi:hypothetical protein